VTDIDASSSGGAANPAVEIGFGVAVVDSTNEADSVGGGACLLTRRTLVVRSLLDFPAVLAAGFGAALPGFAYTADTLSWPAMPGFAFTADTLS
jgi:hypothetical protein